MNEKELPLVTFEQAKELKELGFDWKTCQFYSKGGLIRAAYDSPRNCNDDEYEFAAPAVALALQWMRDVKGIKNAVSFFDVVSPAYTGRYQVGNIINIGEKILKPRSVYETNSYKEFPQAESALLDECLTILENRK